MNCTDCQNRFSDYLDDVLTPEERTALEEHIKLCKSCAQSLLAFKVIVVNASGLEKHRAPDHLWAKIEAELETPGKALHQRLSSSRQSIKYQFSKIFGQLLPAPRLALALALVLIGIAIGKYFDLPNTDRSEKRIAHQPEIDFQVLNTRAEKYLERSKVLLLGIANIDERSDAKLDLSNEKSLSKELLHESTYLKKNISNRQNARIRRLIADLELILLEIANLEERADYENIELLKSGIDQTNLLLKINLNELNKELITPISNKNEGKL